MMGLPLRLGHAGHRARIRGKDTIEVNAADRAFQPAVVPMDSIFHERGIFGPNRILLALPFGLPPQAAVEALQRRVMEVVYPRALLVVADGEAPGGLGQPLRSRSLKHGAHIVRIWLAALCHRHADAADILLR